MQQQIKLIDTNSPEYHLHFKGEFEKAIDGLRDKMFFDANDYYTVIRKKEVMKMLDCGTKLLDTYMDKQGLPHHPGNPIKFIKGEVWDWMKKNFTVAKLNRE